MHTRVRRVGIVVTALLGTVMLAIGATVMSAIAWATTVLVVPGTGTPNPDQSMNYTDHAVEYYVNPAGGDCTAGCAIAGVPYIAQFWPVPLPGWGGLDGAKWDDSVQSGFNRLDDAYYPAGSSAPVDTATVIFGYSQGATVASKYKSYLAANGGIPAGTSFVLIGNPNRPNGGLFERLALLGHVPILDATFGEPTPTDTATPGVINTTDIAFQYDGVTDFPRYPLNPLATLNALAGFWYVHGSYLAPKGDDLPTDGPVGYTPQEVKDAVANATADCTAANFCQESGDTRYITLPAKLLPLMRPVLDLGNATGLQGLTVPLVDLISPVTRVLIELGYDRSDYGTPAPFGFFPALDPVQLGLDLAGGIVEGVTDAVNGQGDASDLTAPPTTSPAPAPLATEPDVSAVDVSAVEVSLPDSPVPDSSVPDAAARTADQPMRATSPGTLRTPTATKQAEQTGQTEPERTKATDTGDTSTEATSTETTVTTEDPATETDESAAGAAGTVDLGTVDLGAGAGDLDTGGASSAGSATDSGGDAPASKALPAAA